MTRLLTTLLICTHIIACNPFRQKVEEVVVDNATNDMITDLGDGRAEYQKAKLLDKEKERNQVDSLIWRSASLGYDSAEYLCGLKLSIHTSRHWFSAFEYFERAAESGHAEAMYQTARYYRYGYEGYRPETDMFDTIYPDYRKALYWFERSAAQGISHAWTEIALMHYHGLGGVPASTTTALDYLYKAEKVHHQAKFYIGYLLEQGKGIQNDHKLAFEWYEKAATEGVVEAIHKMAYACVTGNGRTKNMEVAKKWIIKGCESAAYDSGHHHLFCFDAEENPQLLTDPDKFYALPKELSINRPYDWPEWY